MIKVLQIVNYFYPKIGGIEQVAKDISEVLLKHNEMYEQKIICFNEDAQNDGIVCKRNKTVHDMVNGVEVIRCGCFTKMFSQSMSFIFGSELKKVMDEFKPDIVFFHYPNPFQAKFLLRYKKRNFKLIVYWHLDITRQKILGKLFHFQTFALLNRADKVVATSYTYIKGSPYLSKFENKCTVIPCCINPKVADENVDNVAKVNEIKSKYENKTICFALGRHIPYKGFDFLIQASRYLDDGFKILIGGKGPLTNKLINKAENDRKIEFLGRVSDGDLPAYYKACDIFCFPSITKNEAFGIALAEAMYFGKPAVTFTIPGSGVNYVSLDGVTGIECPNRDVKAYAEALRKLADNQELRDEYGKNARDRVIENFMFDKFEKNICALFDGFLD